MDNNMKLNLTNCEIGSINTTKDIPWYEGLYWCTEDGRVWSHINWKFLSPNCHNWYLYLVLRRDGKSLTVRVNRLAALTYIPNPNNYPIVKHLDNNPLNNHISNLEWNTYSSNLQQAYDDWIHPVTQKLRDTWSKIWKATGKKIMQLTREGILCRIYESTYEAQRITGIHYSHIGHCATWKKYRKTAGGFIWKYI